jgi:hypothetical protein
MERGESEEENNEGSRARGGKHQKQCKKGARVCEGIGGEKKAVQRKNRKTRKTWATSVGIKKGGGVDRGDDASMKRRSVCNVEVKVSGKSVAECKGMAKWRG